MNIPLKFKHLEKLAIDNSPALLTAVGVAGTITTAVLSARGALRYERIVNDLADARLREARYPEDELLDKKDLAKLQVRCFAPAVVVGGCTIAAVIGANRIGSRRAAAVAAAYTLTSEAYSEYKEKVVEKLGEKKEQGIRDEIAEDRVRRNPSSESNVVIVGSGDVLCYDMSTDRYFNSSKQAIDSAVNEINYSINTHGYASVSDFYDLLGLPHTSMSDDMGWNSDKLLEIQFSYVGSEDGRPCVAIDFQTKPARNAHRFH